MSSEVREIARRAAEGMLAVGKEEANKKVEIVGVYHLRGARPDALYA